MSETTNIERRMSGGVKTNSTDEKFKLSIEIENTHSRQHEHHVEKEKHRISFYEALIHLFKAGIGPGKY